MIAYKMICYDIAMKLMQMSVDEKKQQTGIQYSAEMKVVQAGDENVKH